MERDFKMRHAFIITAYKDFEFIKKTVAVYLQEVDCYIHVDKKVTIPKEFKEWVDNTNGVYLFSKYKINWGSYKHISAVLYLMKQEVALYVQLYLKRINIIFITKKIGV